MNDFVGQLKISQPGVSKHLRVLREAGLVEVRQDAQRRLYRGAARAACRGGGVARAVSAPLGRHARRARATPRLIDFLEDALDGRPVDWPNWPEDRWQAHFERYEASMRPIS